VLEIIVERDRLTRNSMGVARHDLLVRAVTRAIDEADPIGLLALGCPPDEYAPEVEAIVPRVSKASGPSEVRQIVHEEFVQSYGTGTPEESFEALSQAIWDAVAEFRAS
jgi:hypothetical protein